MKGENSILFNREQMINIMQLYIDEHLLKDSGKHEVTHINTLTLEGSLEVRVDLIEIKKEKNTINLSKMKRDLKDV